MSQFNTGLIFHEYSKYLNKIRFETNFKSDIINKAEVLNRLKQKYVSTTLHHYGKKFSDFVKTNSAIPSDDCFADLASISIDSKNKMKLSLGLILKSFAEFFFEWSVFLGYILFNKLTKQCRKTSSVSLFFGVGIESILNENSDKRFVSYLNSYDKHKIDPLGQFDTLIVKSNQKISSSADNIFYAKYPQAYFLLKYYFSWDQYIRIICLHFLSVYDFLKIIFFHSELIPIIRDFSCLRVFKYMADRGFIKDVMYTMSNATYQPLWMRLPEIKVHKIHHSQNCRQFVYKDYLREDVHPYFHEVYADTAWVWTTDFKQFISKIYKCNDFRVVGPIMSYLPTDNLQGHNYNSSEFNISLFDVTPISDDFANRTGLLNNYYCGDILKMFLNDIVSAIDEVETDLKIKINIFLKHKRGFHKDHEKSYIALCEKFIQEDRIISIPYEENIFNIILGTDLSLAIPYTSTAHICSYYNRRSLYYDPTGTVLLQPHFSDQVTMVGSKTELYEIIKDKVLNKFKTL